MLSMRGISQMLSYISATLTARTTASNCAVPRNVLYLSPIPPPVLTPVPPRLYPEYFQLPKLKGTTVDTSSLKCTC